MAEIANSLASMHVDIRSINTRTLKDRDTIITLTIAVNGVEHLNSVIKNLRKIDGIISIERTGV